MKNTQAHTIISTWEMRQEDYYKFEVSLSYLVSS